LGVLPYFFIIILHYVQIFLALIFLFVNVVNPITRFIGSHFMAVFELFELIVESNSRLLWFCFTSLCDWFIKLMPLSQPIRSKTKSNCFFSLPFSCAWCTLHVFALSFQPIRSKTKSNCFFSLPFSRAWCTLHVFALSSYWFIG